MSAWFRKRVLVTGGAGFLGTHLVERLVREDAYVVCLVHRHEPRRLDDGLPDVVNLRGSIEDLDRIIEILREWKVDGIFHLAAQAIVSEARKDVRATMETNARGTWNVLEAARLYGDQVKAVVVASSDKAYGASNKLPYKEDDPLLGDDVYDMSKACADRVAQRFAIEFGMPIAISRCGNLYGPGDTHWSRIIPGTIRSLLLGEKPIIRGDGRSLRDYFYVEDAAAALLALSSALLEGREDVRGQSFNFGTEQPTQVIDVVKALIWRSGLNVKPQVLGEAKGEIPAQWLDCAKARRMLGWSYRTAIGGGLDSTWAWYKANRKRLLGGVDGKAR